MDTIRTFFELPEELKQHLVEDKKRQDILNNAGWSYNDTTGQPGQSSGTTNSAGRTGAAYANQQTYTNPGYGTQQGFQSGYAQAANPGYAQAANPGYGNAYTGYTQQTGYSPYGYQPVPENHRMMVTLNNYPKNAVRMSVDGSDYYPMQTNCPLWFQLPVGYHILRFKYFLGDQSFEILLNTDLVVEVYWKTQGKGVEIRVTACDLGMNV